MRMKKLLSLFLAATLFVTAAFATMITAEATLVDSGNDKETLLDIRTINATLTLEGYSDEELKSMPLKTVLDKIQCNDNGNTYTIGASIDANPELKVVWTRYFDENGYAETDEYRVEDMNATVDMSKNIADDSYYYTMEIILGSGKQLDKGNVRIKVSVTVTPRAEVEYGFSDYLWFENEDGTRTSGKARLYEDYGYGTTEIVDFDGTIKKEPYKIFRIENMGETSENEAYAAMWVTPVIPEGCTEDDVEVKVYSEIRSEETEISDKIFSRSSDITTGMNTAGTGLSIRCSEDMMYVYDYIIDYYVKGERKNTEVVELYSQAARDTLYSGYLYDQNGENASFTKYINYSSSDNKEIVFRLYKGYSVTGTYNLEVDAYSYSRVVEGACTTVEEIEALDDISYALRNGTYSVDFSKENKITTLQREYFDGEYYNYITVYTLKAEETSIEKKESSDDDGNRPYLQRDPFLRVEAISTKDFDDPTEFVADNYNTPLDSYYAYGYQTLFTADDIDMSQLYLEVTGNKSDDVYDSVHANKIDFSKAQDFTNGKVQYTVSTGKAIRNYFVTILKKQSGGAKLYVNGPSERTVNLDSLFDYRHDILVANVGDAPLTGLKVEWSKAPQNIKLHDYWTTGGENNDTLSPMTDASVTDYMAKIRLLPDGEGTISGQLKISADGQEPVYIDITGLAGNPEIVTESPLPDAVKHVPYSVIVATNNIYEWATPKFSYYGKLPKGVTFNEATGEIYGVPQETGTFEFHVYVNFNDESGSYVLSTQTKDFTFEVLENTDQNVYEASDESYHIITHLGTADMYFNGVAEPTEEYDYFLSVAQVEKDQLFTSNGTYGNFIDLWLNGEKLTKGVDYTYVEGSTKITVMSQTLKGLEENETNTIAAEFRVDGDTDKELKRTAQNFVVYNSDYEPDDDDTGNGDDNTGGEVVGPITPSIPTGPQLPGAGYGSAEGGSTSADTSADTNEDDAVKKVIELINKIPDEIDENAADEIDAARKAYDGLTPAQQDKVTNYDDLTAAEKALSELEETEDDTSDDVEDDVDIEDDVEDDVETDDDDNDDEAMLSTTGFIGRVTDENGEKLSGLSIEIHSEVQTTSTDNSGSFKFDAVEFGSHTLTITDAEGNSAVKEFKLTEGDKFSVSDDEIVAKAGGLFELNIMFDGETIEFLSSSQGDTQSGSTGGFFDESNPETGVALPLIAVGAAASLAAAVHFGKKKKSDEE